MSVVIIRRRNPNRLRSVDQLRHTPTIFGQGKWESLKCFWNYKLKSRRLRNIAEESRKRNRGTR